MHEGSMNGKFYGREFKNHEISTVYMYEETVDITKLKLQKEEVEEVMWMDQEELNSESERWWDFQIVYTWMK